MAELAAAKVNFSNLRRFG